MTVLPIFDEDGITKPYFIRALKILLEKYPIELSTADNKFEKIKELWLQEYNSVLVDNENSYFNSIHFVNAIDGTKFSLSFN
jgi:hypothetical protein